MARHFALDILGKAVATKATIVVPNNRLRDAILNELMSVSEVSVYQLPRVFAVDIWIRDSWDILASLGEAPFCDLQLIGATEELLLWTGLVESTRASYPLLNAEDTAVAVGQAYQLMKQWQLDQPDRQVLDSFSGIADVAAFLDWSDRFQSRCQDLQCVNLVDATAILAQWLREDSQRLDLLPDRDMVLVDFYQPPPLYQELFAALPVSARPMTASRQLDLAKKETRRFEFESEWQETVACIEWIAATLEQDPDAHIAIICCSREARQQQFTRALEDRLDPHGLLLEQHRELFNSPGHAAALLDSGLIHDALLMLGLQREAQLSDDLCRLLHSPYLPASTAERQARIGLEWYMRRRFARQTLVSEWLTAMSSGVETAMSAEAETAMSEHRQASTGENRHCPELQQRLLRFRTRMRAMPARTNAASWSECFAALLADLGWPGPAPGPRDRMLLERWENLLQQFALLSRTLGPMDADTALSRLRLLCQQTPQQRESRLQHNVSYYSVSEALGLRFDHLWLLGFHDQAFPPATAPSPFLPYALQKQAQLPGSHSDVQYASASMDFAVLLNSTSATVIASHARSDGEQQYRPSSFTLAFTRPEMDMRDSAVDTESDTETSSMEIVQSPALPRLSLEVGQQQELATVPDIPLLPLGADEVISGGHSVLSHQSACPFQAFSAHRLKAEPLAEFISGLSPMSRGTAVHLALEHLFAVIDGSARLMAMDTVQRQQLCDRAADIAVKFLQRRHPHLMTPAFSAIEQRRLQGQLLAYLETEEKRAAFTVHGREENLQWRWRQLSLNLKVDRIDRLDDGSLAILDYKTGKSAPSRRSLLEERPEDLQLAVYSVAGADSYPEPVSVLSLAHLHAERIGFSGLAKASNFHRALAPVEEDKNIGMGWEELLARFGNMVTARADEFVDGLITVTPAHDQLSCDRCQRQSLCRIHELGLEDCAESEMTPGGDLADD